MISVTLVVASLGASVAYSTKAESEAIAEMVKAGADPIAATCAVKGINHLNREICSGVPKK